VPTVATALTSGVQSLARALGPSNHGEHSSECVLYPLDPRTDRIVPGAGFRLQYFPESVKSSKPPNWQQKEVPGGSLPIYQFVAGGEHLVSYTAMLSCDTDLLSNEGLHAELESEGLRERNPDLRAALAWLRQFVLPRYPSGGSPAVTAPPRKLMVSMPGTGIGLLAGVAPNTQALLVDSFFAQMTQCDVTLQKLFPSGLPRLIQMDLAFAQTAQYGGAVSFPGVSNVHDRLLTTGDPFRPYRLRPRAQPGRR